MGICCIVIMPEFRLYVQNTFIMASSNLAGHKAYYILCDVAASPALKK